MAVQIVEEAFEPYQALLAQQQALQQQHGNGAVGACASFVGSMRDFNEGDDVNGLYLEHYPGMTEKQLASIIDDARLNWRIVDALIIHRVGDLAPGDPIVLTVVWSAHRADAFEACRFLMEELKSRATFWKKETLVNGETRWIAENTPGYTKADG